MTTNFFSTSTIIEDLQDLYLKTLDKKQYAVAFKIKELLGREIGLFSQRNKEKSTKKISVDSLSDEDLTHLIEELESKLKNISSE